MKPNKEFKKRDWKFTKKQVKSIYWTSTIIAGLFLGLSLLSTYLIAGLPNDNSFVLFVKEQKFYFPFFMTIGFFCLITSLLSIVPTLKTIWVNVSKMRQYGDLTKQEGDYFEKGVDNVSERLTKEETIKEIEDIKIYEDIVKELKEIEKQEEKLIINNEPLKEIKPIETRIKSDY